ncbi:hypothetical protein O6H91_14G071400 [Diphasiastrum complanatum]|uniref:Uncharacterized protein n=1 Tax=Diphasiastrum complanatum TaxID=34168 RepID=A0ACC2BQN0_DIPCM|nr:hypothetical protein O6H91_14G071400 [Diphasiastrum complanatum]
MASATSPSSSLTFCSHCEREVPATNFELHFAHCARNLERCSYCGDMIAKLRAEEHYNESHAQAACSLCGAKMERVMIMSHEHDKCPQRLLACVYCEFPVAAADLETHSNVCGSRTELCIPCGKYVRLRERIGHDLQYHSQNNETGTSSRDYTLLQSVPSVSDIPRRPDPHRRPASTASRQLLVTFVVTGVAILIGTVLFQRRAPSHEQQ